MKGCTKNMKTKDLRTLFYNMGSLLTPPFVPDTSINRNNAPSGFIAMKRPTNLGQWQFLALTRHPQISQFHIEAALSPLENFPLDSFEGEPELVQKNGAIRFRITDIWNTANHKATNGWVVDEIASAPNLGIGIIRKDAEEFGIPNEGIFSAVQEAIDDVENKVIKYVLPHLDNISKI